MHQSAASTLLKSRTATSLMFLVCGIGVATWAPMVPLAKQRTGLNEAGLGAILLAMGAGAIVTMPFMGRVIQRTGSRLVIVLTALIIALMLPVLTIVSAPASLTVALFIFGAAVGSLDVAMNAQAVVVQDEMRKPIMSSFHALFSVGGLIGSVGLGLLMSAGLSLFWSAATIGALLLVVALTQFQSFLDHPEREGGHESFRFRLPKGPVVMLGIFCFFTFLVEGAMLDWSALLLRAERGFSMSAAGTGYAVFSVAMAMMRFTGDTLVRRFGDGKLVFWGALFSAAGILVVVLFPFPGAALGGFLLIGIGAANIVPVLFSAAGKADPRSPEIGLAAVTTLGYSGQLAGPAIIGFVAQVSSLPLAFGALALPMLMVAFTFRGTSRQPAAVASKPA